MNIANWLFRQAQVSPDNIALVHGIEEVATYAVFDRRTRGLANALKAHGVGPGDRVAIFLLNHPDYLVCLFAIWCAGAVAVPVNARLHAREATWILSNAGAKLVFSGGAQHEALEKAGCEITMIRCGCADFETLTLDDPIVAPIERKPADLAWLFYTSGTTGKPKGVMITHRMLTCVSLGYPVDVDTVQSMDHALYAAPLSHGAGLYSLVHVLAGARHVIPVSGGFDPAEILELAERFGSVHMFAAPTMVKRLAEYAHQSGQTGAGLRTIVYAGGPMYTADIIEAVAQFGDVFVQIYGQGECPMAITALPRADVSERGKAGWQARLASVGRAQSAVEVAIGDANARVLPVGQVGEVMVRGDTVMPGYWNNPDATSKTLIDGWLMTGDMGVLDAEGYLTLKDRSKDLIISGGSNVYPREVEEVLLTHRDVREVAVVGRPDPRWGEEIVAFVVGDVAPEELDQLCLEQIARFKRPKDYFFVPELPKNNYGKVLKTRLRERLNKQGRTLIEGPA